MENLIEELTKVNPANLSEEGLKLFNKIMEIIDRNEELETNIHCIEKDLEIAIIDDFDELERILKNDIDLSETTLQWLEDILHKDMNRFFKHIMIRLGHPDYMEGDK